MKGELLKRLFRAVSLESTEEAARVCNLVIDEERKLGHSVLATQLKRILEDAVNSADFVSRSRKTLGTLPKSRRTDDPLVSFRPTEILRHHMVLAADVEERFLRIENEFYARERLNSYGLLHRSRVLLYGPSGCGKSMGAERLAYNTGLPYFRVRFDSLISSLFGESASNLHRVFEMAAEHPCLLFLDECDFIAKSRRTTNEVGEVPRIVNTLLQLMEDYAGSGLIVAATNLTDQLDEALFRRFDDVIHLPSPGHDEVIRLLQESFGHLHPKGLDFESIASDLAGLSAAFVVKLAQDSCKAAILEGRSEVTADDVEKARKELYAGKSAKP